MPLPLEGLLVLDLTQMAAGPYATMLLGDMGADVIKIERPGWGDPSRSLPPFKHDGGGDRVAAGILRTGRNKRSLALDIARPAGREIFLQLARKADVVWENFVPGTMERLGLGYEPLARQNPRLIYAAISGFGRTGSPDRDRAALDLVAQAESGLMEVTGDAGGPPSFVGAVAGDLVAALYGVIGTLEALLLRNLTGRGTLVDVAMTDSLLALNERALLFHSLTGEAIGRGNLGHAGPYGRFATRDGYVVIAASIESLWTRLCRALEREDLLAHAPAADETGTWWRFGELLAPLLEAWAARRTSDEVLDILRRHAVPAARVATVAEAARSAHARARHMLLHAMHPVAGSYDVVGSPIKIDGVPEPEVRWVPDLGEHTDEVLQTRLGLDLEQIADLRRQGIVA